MSGFSSMFSQLLKLFPRTEFQALVKRTYAERHARGFTCWGQFVAILFCQFGRALDELDTADRLRSGWWLAFGGIRRLDRRSRSTDSRIFGTAHCALGCRHVAKIDLESTECPLILAQP